MASLPPWSSKTTSGSGLALGLNYGFRVASSCCSESAARRASVGFCSYTPSKSTSMSRTAGASASFSVCLPHRSRIQRLNMSYVSAPHASFLRVPRGCILTMEARAREVWARRPVGPVRATPYGSRSPRWAGTTKGSFEGYALPREGDTVSGTTLKDNGRRSRLAHCGAQTRMNTTKLIAQWTMDGTRYDIESHSRATDDVGAPIADRQPTREPPQAASSFLIRGTNEDGWQTLDV